MCSAAETMQEGTFAAEAWLQALEFPRPNGSAALDSASALLHTSLRSVGLEPQAIPFDCHPHRGQAAALVLLLATLLLALAGHRRSRGLAAAALGLWFVAAGFGIGNFDVLLPGRAQSCLLVSVEAEAAVRHEILLLAHLDSKSEPLDHVGRTLLICFAVASGLGACGLLLARWKPPLWILSCAVLAHLGLAAQLSLGRWLPERSAGIIDDAGACVLLADLAAELKQQPMRHTQVHFLWTTGEEVGAQGAAAAVRHPRFPAVDHYVNLEGIGAGPHLATAPWELGNGRPFPASEAVRRDLRRCTDSLGSIPFPLWTDAGALQAAGLKGATLVNLQPGAVTIRGLHGATDRLERFDWKGYARTRTLLRCSVAAWEGAPERTRI